MNELNSESILTECDREQIQFIGHSQFHGMIIVINQNHRIQAISQNCFQLLGKHSNSLLKTHVFDLIPNYLELTKNLEQVQVIDLIDFEKEQISFQAVFHQTGNEIIIDLVPHRENSLGKVEVEAVKNEQDLQHCLDKMNRGSGLDRVLLYLFERNGDGVVVAESKGLMGTSLMNHWFPATDIPVQARQLYVKNKIRFISNVKKEAIPLVGMIEPEEIDLSSSWLRAVSPVHIEYLKNMSVSCSLSTSLVRQGELIGLIACHSFTPVTIDFKQMELLLELSHSIEDYLNREHDELLKKQQKQLEQWFYSGEKNLDLISNLFDADRAELIDQKVLQHAEQVIFPQSQKIFYAESTSQEIPSLHKKEYPGLACVKLDHLGEGKVLVLYREEFSHDKIWGGAPRSKIPYKGGRIEPRKSFESFVENVRNKSRSWSEMDIKCLNFLSSLNQS